MVIDMRKIWIAAVTSLVFLILPFVISAHDMWVEITGTPAQGSFLTLRFPSDHAFPAKGNEFISKDELAESYIITPGGNRMQLDNIDNNRFRSAEKLSQTGSYTLVSGKKWLYWTKTPQGWKTGLSKSQVPNAIKTVYSGKFTKSFFTVGSPAGNSWKTVTGHDLELVPQSDPSLLKKGDFIEFQVLFKGKPFSGQVVQATYAGFSQKDGVFSQKLKTNRKGIIKVTLNKSGKWLVLTGYRGPSTNPREYDEILYSSTVTFTVQ